MSNEKFNNEIFEKDIRNYKRNIISSVVASCHVSNIFLLMAFHEVGAGIQTKGEYKRLYVMRLSNDLKDCHFYINENDIYKICRFSQLISIEEIIELRIYELKWEELCSIIDESRNHDEFIELLSNELEKGEA